MKKVIGFSGYLLLAISLAGCSVPFFNSKSLPTIAPVKTSPIEFGKLNEVTPATPTTSVTTFNEVPTKIVNQEPIKPIVIETKGITMAEVVKHNSALSCYLVVNSRVYDMTEYLNLHPGGVRAVLKLCGTDATSQYAGQHGGQSKPEAALKTYKIGDLAK